TPGTAVRTVWKTGDIWIRRSFDLADAKRHDVQLLMHHDEDAEVYLNGVLAAKGQGYTTDYRLFRLSAEVQAVLKTGRNTIAIHCHQTGGGQYIDAGLVDVAERE